MERVSTSSEEGIGAPPMLPNVAMIPVDNDDDVYLIKITTCGLQNLSPY
jgi:hypothetical protein